MRDTTKTRKTLYETLKANQGRISKSCEMVGISRMTYYNWRKKHPKWAKQIDEIENNFIEAIKVKGISLAIEGNTSMIQFILKNKLSDEFNVPDKIAPTDPSGQKSWSFHEFVKAVNEETQTGK